MTGFSLVACAAACLSLGTPDFSHQLVAPPPAAAAVPPLADFGRLIGSWKMRSHTFGPAGAPAHAREALWTFSWVLQGRAVQDVFAVIDPGGGYSEYGTTVRMYRPSCDCWSVTYFGPKHELSVSFVAARKGTDMVMRRSEANGDYTRWVFDSISQNHFRWRALTSRDRGRSWRLDQVMSGERVG